MLLIQKPIPVMFNQFWNPGDCGRNHWQSHCHRLEQHIGDSIPVAIVSLDGSQHKEAGALKYRDELLLSPIAFQRDLSGHIMSLDPLRQLLAKWTVSVNGTLEALTSLFDEKQRSEER